MSCCSLLRLLSVSSAVCMRDFVCCCSCFFLFVCVGLDVVIFFLVSEVECVRSVAKQDKYLCHFIAIAAMGRN